MQEFLHHWLDNDYVRLALDAATPLAVLIAGWMLKRREQLNGALIGKRIVIYEEIAAPANDILCFYMAVGRWRELSPDKVIALKRGIDRAMHVYRHFWSSDVWRAYQRFNAACFQEFGGAGEPAKLRLEVGMLRRLMGQGWQDNWMAQVAAGEHGVAAVRDAYEKWMMAFAREIGVRES